MTNNTSASTADRHRISLIPGDGIGPEVSAAVQTVLDAAGFHADWETVEAGKKVFEAGVASGVTRETIDSLSSTRVALKGPLETPIGFGGKSANVTLRKLFETFGNLRPVCDLPGVITPFSGRGIDLVVVRENVEDLYAGIEHCQTPDVAQCLKLISVKGCEKIARLAYELAVAEGRHSVHVATKANIMKKTEGLFKRVFEEVGRDYPDITGHHILIDNCAHQLVIRPEQFEIILTTNMNGDIISDLTSGLVGGLGLAASANIGHGIAIFEAVHGSAPDIAGQDKANPTALLLSAVMMLRYLGEFSIADKVEHALYVTLEAGKGLTGDIARGRPAIGTRAFTAAIVSNLGKISPFKIKRAYQPVQVPERMPSIALTHPRERSVTGLDVFVEFDGAADNLGAKLEKAAAPTSFTLKMISNRGTMVYPGSGAATDCVDHWRCRFIVDKPGEDLDHDQVAKLLSQLSQAGLRWMHLEKLNRFDGEDAFTRAQGED